MIAVFVPGALAGGLLVSLALLAGDVVRRIRGDAAARRAACIAALSAHAIVDGESPRTVRSGLRSRRVYGTAALVSWSLVALAVPGAFWNFWNPGGYLSDIGWAWALSTLATLAIGAVGAASLRLAPPWAAPIVALVGLGASARFAFGPEDLPLGAVATVGLPATVLAVLLARWWSQRVTSDVPSWVRPLLRATPLGRAP